MISTQRMWLTRKEVEEIYGFGWRSLENFVDNGEVKRVKIQASSRTGNTERKNLHCRYSREDLNRAMEARASGGKIRAVGAKRGRKSIWGIAK